MLSRGGVRPFLLAASAVLILSLTVPSRGGNPWSTEFDSARWLGHLRFLGSDRLAGRAVGTAGADEAAEYIAAELREAGLQPMGDDGYFQRIPMRGATPLPESVLTLVRGSSEERLELGADYLLFRTGSETFITNPVPTVFAGFGIIAPEFDYNSYQDIDVSGKIVVLLTGEPESVDRSYFEGEVQTVYSDPEAKHRLAISRGARGTILIPDPRDPSSGDWSLWRNEFSFEHVSLGYGPVGSFSIMMNPSAAARLFDGSGHDLKEILGTKGSSELVSFSLETRLSFHGVFAEREFVGRNVIGLLPGSDRGLRETALLLSAHYDGLGVGPAVAGDSIYNGVFDNAAGVAALLGMARALAARPSRPERSILFLFTTGEEKGLLGSLFYTAHPVMPLYQTIANVNVDGIASFDTFRDVFGVGAPLSTLNETLLETAAAFDLAVTPVPTERERRAAFARSDQVAFAEAGIPSIHILEGIRYEHWSEREVLARLNRWYKEVYHTPFDDLSQILNLEAVSRHWTFILAFCDRLAGPSRPPEWLEGSPYLHARLQTIAERR